MIRSRRSNECELVLENQYKNNKNHMESEVRQDIDREIISYIEHGDSVIEQSTKKIIMKKSSLASGQSNGLTCLVAFFTILSIVSFVLDLVTDIVTVWILYHKRKVWFWTSLVLLLGSLYIINVLSFYWYVKNTKSKTIPKASTLGWTFRAIFHSFLLGPICRQVEILYLGICSRISKSFNHKPYILQRKDTAHLQILDAFPQDAPQFALQIYIWTFVNKSSKALCDWHCWAQLTSIIFSVVSLSISVVNYEYSKRIHLPSEEHEKTSFIFLQFLWRLGTTASRLLAIILGLISAPTFTLAILCFHWLIITIVFMRHCEEISGTADKPSCRIDNFFQNVYNFIIGIVHIFCYMNPYDTPTRDSSSIFYVATCIEDIVFISLWYWAEYHNDDSDIWIVNMAAPVYFTCFLTGLASMRCYIMKITTKQKILEVVQDNETKLQEDVNINTNGSGDFVNANDDDLVITTYYMEES